VYEYRVEDLQMTVLDTGDPFEGPDGAIAFSVIVPCASKDCAFPIQIFTARERSETQASVKDDALGWKVHVACLKGHRVPAILEPSVSQFRGPRP
jgi:hypothetical protein